LPAVPSLGRWTRGPGELGGSGCYAGIDGRGGWPAHRSSVKRDAERPAQDGSEPGSARSLAVLLAARHWAAASQRM
jgi:hypothetical protein